MSRVLLALFIILGSFEASWAQGQREQEMVVNITAPAVESEDTFVAQELEVKAALAEVDESVDEVELRTPRGYRYLFPLNPPSELSQELFGAMSPANREKFQEKRIFILSRLASVLEKTRLALGFGSLAKEKFINIFRRKHKRTHPLKFAQSTQAGQARVSAILRAFDLQMWESAPVIAQQNEIGLTGSVGVSFYAGVPGARTFGGSGSLGITLGFNSDTKQMVFEFFTEVGLMDKAMTPTFIFGFLPKGGIIFKDQIKGREMAVERGATFYPPLPFYTDKLGSQGVIGLTSSFFTLPFSAFADFMGYVTKTWKIPLLRVAVGPTIKGAPQVHLVSGAEVKGSIVSSVTKVFGDIQAAYRKLFRKGAPKEQEMLNTECELMIISPAEAKNSLETDPFIEKEHDQAS